MNQTIECFLNAHYAEGPFRLEAQLDTNGQRLAYRAVTSTGRRVVVKLTDPGRPEAVVHADVNTPGYLSSLGFPAPRPLADRDGRLYLPYEDRYLYVYEYIPGEHPRPSGAFYARLGTLLARLHSLPCGSVPESAYHPPEILNCVRDYLMNVEFSPQLPEEQRAVLPHLYRLIDEMPSFEALPRGIIHTDPYYVNLIDMPSTDGPSSDNPSTDGPSTDGPSPELALIDWEDGGVSYPLLDVGYVLGPMSTFTARDRRLWDVPGPPDGLSWRPDWGEIFLAAYEALRPLTPAERALLPAAVRVSFLVYIPMWGDNQIILDNNLRMQMVAPD